MHAVVIFRRESSHRIKLHLLKIKYIKLPGSYLKVKKTPLLATQKPPCLLAHTNVVVVAIHRHTHTTTTKLSPRNNRQTANFSKKKIYSSSLISTIVFFHLRAGTRRLKRISISRKERCFISGIQIHDMTVQMSAVAAQMYPLFPPRFHLSVLSM